MYTPVHVINKNSKTAYIAAWQQFLANQHYNVGGIDGVWGHHTTQFTAQFQRDNKLGVDGKVGPATLKNAQNQHGFQFPLIKNLEIAGQSNIVIDVSHYQKYNPRTDTDSICFENAYQAGIRAVIHKCSEHRNNKNSIDPTYHRRVAEAKAAGLLWGAYHFGGAGSGLEQANFFLSEVGHSEDTVLVLDWETTNMAVSDAVDFITTVHSKTGKYPMLYSRARFINDAHPNNAQLAILTQCPLWLSAYTWKTLHPSLPNGWDQYTIWQFSDSIHGHGAVPVPGIGDCDRNLYNGSPEALQTFWAAHSIHSNPSI